MQKTNNLTNKQKIVGGIIGTSITLIVFMTINVVYGEVKYENFSELSPSVQQKHQLFLENAYKQLEIEEKEREEKNNNANNNNNKTTFTEKNTNKTTYIKDKIKFSLITSFKNFNSITYLYYINNTNSIPITAKEVEYEILDQNNNIIGYNEAIIWKTIPPNGYIIVKLITYNSDVTDLNSVYRINPTLSYEY